VGVMWEVTASRRLQAKLDAIDAAGAELMNIRAETIGSMNNAQRLKLLEGKITHYVHELLNFDNFEIRLLDRETRRLELVMAVGLAPLKIGETIYARETANGISGYVAVKGESYICPDVRSDPLYCEGLHNAASSLTVPLKLHDEVIGVFNIESYTPNQFTENDRKFAEIFGRYIAAAMNILDLLVVEQYTTNEQLTQNVLGELSEPLAEITSRALELKAHAGIDPSLRASLDSLVQATESMRRRIEACTSGPRSVLGAEQMLRDAEVDPAMEGKRVLVADDEPTIRETLARILRQKGCEVLACKDGIETIQAIDQSKLDNRPFDLVITDIRMPGRNGYEVFRAAKAVDRGTAVILMTGFGYDPNHSIVRAADEGLHSFLFKPFKASVLLESVSSALQRV
jgi:CheY-like chemotaxis protein/GAF domain-containing protein